MVSRNFRETVNLLLAITLFNLLHGLIIFEQDFSELVLLSHFYRPFVSEFIGAHMIESFLTFCCRTVTGLYNWISLLRHVSVLSNFSFDHIIITFCECAVVFFDPVYDFGEISFIVADRPHHFEVVLEVLDLLVKNHQIYHYSGIFKSLDIQLVFADVFCAPF